MKRRVLSVLLMLFLLLALLPLPVLAEDADAPVSAVAAGGETGSEADALLAGAEAPNGYIPGVSTANRGQPKKTATEGSCGDALTWRFSDGELVISGTGAMTEFEGRSDAPWHDLRASVKKITIQPGVTSVSQFAFCDLSSLTEVSIPDTVTEIGRMAFICCYSLTAIVLPETVTEIPYALFGDCTMLQSVTAPGVTTIGDYAFQSTSLSAFAISEKLTNISDAAFFRAPIVAFTVAAGNPVFTVSEGVLYTDGGKTLFAYPTGNSTETFSIPTTVTKVGRDAFAYTKHLKQVTIPDSVETLG